MEEICDLVNWLRIESSGGGLLMLPILKLLGFIPEKKTT
jgi:hypothetical protein